MNFYSVRDLRTYPKDIWQKLSETGEVVITNNGKPTALMLEVDDTNLEDVILAFRQANAMRAVNRMRISAQKNGHVSLSDDEISDEINKARKGIQ
jgi:hypothetical protein